MKDESYVRNALAHFEPLGDQRLKEEIDRIKIALECGQVDYAAKVLAPKLYAKREELVLSDLLAVMPQEGFDEPRRLIRDGYYRAAANEINRLIHSGLGLWHPDEKAREILRLFWDYYAG